MTFESQVCFTPLNIPMERMEELHRLMTLCDIAHIKLSTIKFFQNGFVVMFEGHKCGDAVLHDNSYNNEELMWETIDFPWDHGDVSTHTSLELVSLIQDLK